MFKKIVIMYKELHNSRNFINIILSLIVPKADTLFPTTIDEDLLSLTKIKHS